MVSFINIIVRFSNFMFIYIYYYNIIILIMEITFIASTKEYQRVVQHIQSDHRHPFNHEESVAK